MFKEISFNEFNAGTANGVCIRGGVMLDESSYMEYGAGADLFRYEVGMDGSQKWFKFVPAA